MADIPQIRQVMTASPRTIDAGQTVHQAQQLMEQHDIRHLPVLEAGKVVGVLSDRDVKMALDPMINFPSMWRVRDIMTRDIYAVHPDEDLDVVLATLAERRIGCALVASNGDLNGIFTTTDAARLLGEYLRGTGD